MDLTARHPGTQQIARWFSYEHLPTHLQPVSSACVTLAATMLAALPDGPELTAGLRKLLEAKDCFVRAALGAHDDVQQQLKTAVEAAETRGPVKYASEETAKPVTHRDDEFWDSPQAT